MKKYKLRTTVGNYKIGDEVTAAEISQLLNIPQCIQCGWLVEVDTRVWDILEFSFKHKNGESIEISSEPATSYYYDVIKEYPGAVIKSVIRVSDGVVFTVGDWFEGGMERGRINSFNINEGGAIFLNSNPTQKFGLNISVAKLVAKRSRLENIFSQRIGKSGTFIGPASLAEHPMCKKEEPAKTGLAMDISRGTMAEAIQLGKLWEKFQPHVIPAIHFKKGEFDGIKFNRFLFDEQMQWKEEITIGNGWMILSFEMKKAGSSTELVDGIYTRKPDGLFHKGDVSMPARWFIVNKAEIHSVERLRDHSIFTVGEETNYGTIERIIKSWVGIEVHFTNGNGATLESLEKKVKDDRRVKNMTAHNLSAEGVTIKAIVRGDVTDTDLKKINQAIEGILSKKKK